MTRTNSEAVLAKCIQKRRVAKDGFDIAIRDLKKVLSDKHKITYGRRSEDERTTA